MKQRRRPLFLGIFQDEDDLLQATAATRRAGLSIVDIYTPYAVHGLEKAAGLRPSRLTWVCFGFAFLGFISALWLQFWIGSIDWPLNVGGRPFNSLPAYLPVTFELTVLLGGLGVVFTMLARARLFPGKKPLLVDSRVTDNRFVLALDADRADFDPTQVQMLWQKSNVVETKLFEAERRRG